MSEDVWRVPGSIKARDREGAGEGRRSYLNVFYRDLCCGRLTACYAQHGSRTTRTTPRGAWVDPEVLGMKVRTWSVSGMVFAMGAGFPAVGPLFRVGLGVLGEGKEEARPPPDCQYGAPSLCLY